MVFNLMEGFTKHHCNYIPNNFKSKNGTEAKNDSDNTKILNNHLSSLFNSQVPVDLTVLDKLPQHRIKHEFGETLTHAKVQSAVNSMEHDKSPGQSGLSTDMIKSLPPRALNYYVKLIQDFWNDPNTDFSSWHITLLKVLCKGKGDTQDPNNNRGITLKKTSAKVLSIIIAQRLLKKLKQINPTSQFGHIGCKEPSTQ